MTTIDFFKLFATQGGNSLTALTRPSYCLFRGRFVFLVVYLHFRVEMTRPLWGYSAYLLNLDAFIMSILKNARMSDTIFVSSSRYLMLLTAFMTRHAKEKQQMSGRSERTPLGVRELAT